MRLAGKALKHGDNVDTDVITHGALAQATGDDVTDMQALARACMSGIDPDFYSRHRPGDLIVAGRNFGCGSSREHAPWALLAFGFRALIGVSFADIFLGNCLKNGLLPVVIPPETYAELLRMVEKDPNVEVTVDLASQTVTLPGGKTASFPVDNFSKQCLLGGVDQLGYVLKQEPHIRAYEDSHPAPVQITISS